MAERVWAGLDPVAADGLACVVCARDFRTPGSSAVPVGRSHTGSQVFTCAGACVAATGEAVAGHRAAPGETAGATGGTAVPPLGVPVDAVDALCDASPWFSRPGQEAALRDTAGEGTPEGSARYSAVSWAAPLVVAAELRGWVSLIRFKRGLIPDADLVESTVRLLDRRADELDGGETSPSVAEAAEPEEDEL